MRTTNPRIDSGVVDVIVHSKEFKYDQATKCRKDLAPKKTLCILMTLRLI